jgi:hypothetical protein
VNASRWPWLLLAIVLGLASSHPALAQRPRAGRTLKPIGLAVQGMEPASYRPLAGGADHYADAEKKLAARLGALQQIQDLREAQKSVGNLLKNPAFLENLRKSLTEKDIENLRQRFRRGENLQNDPAWGKFLQQATRARPGGVPPLSEKQLEALLKLAATGQGAGPGNAPMPPMPPGAQQAGPVPAPSNPAPPPVPPAPSPSDGSSPSTAWERLQQDSSAWFQRNLDSLGEDMAGALDDLGNGDDGRPLGELVRSLTSYAQREGSLGMNAAEQMHGLSRYLPDMSHYAPSQSPAWGNLVSGLRRTHLPSLPSLGGSPGRAPLSSGGPSGQSAGHGLVLLLALVVLALVLWKAGRRREGLAGAEGDGWHLGPWPVAPGGVAGRQDLIRAFEYLALLCLGPEAATCNHLDLADRLGSSPSPTDGLDTNLRRQAAERLARLYEQARYAPGDAPLPEEELAAARRDLCYLAGVAAA